MLKRKYKNTGFSLPELLVCVAIIAVLAVIAISTLPSLLESSRERTDVANLRTAKALVLSSWMQNDVAGEYRFDAARGVMVPMEQYTPGSIDGYGKGEKRVGDKNTQFYMGDEYGYYSPKSEVRDCIIGATVDDDGNLNLFWCKDTTGDVLIGGGAGEITYKITAGAGQSVEKGDPHFICCKWKLFPLR